MRMGCPFLSGLAVSPYLLLWGPPALGSEHLVSTVQKAIYPPWCQRPLSPVPQVHLRWPTCFPATSLLVGSCQVHFALNPLCYLILVLPCHALFWTLFCYIQYIFATPGSFCLYFFLSCFCDKSPPVGASHICLWLSSLLWVLINCVS